MLYRENDWLQSRVIDLLIANTSSSYPGSKDTWKHLWSVCSTPGVVLRWNLNRKKVGTLSCYVTCKNKKLCVCLMELFMSQVSTPSIYRRFEPLDIFKSRFCLKLVDFFPPSFTKMFCNGNSGFCVLQLTPLFSIICRLRHNSQKNNHDPWAKLLEESEFTRWAFWKKGVKGRLTGCNTGA